VLLHISVETEILVFHDYLMNRKFKKLEIFCYIKNEFTSILISLKHSLKTKKLKLLNGSIFPRFPKNVSS